MDTLTALRFVQGAVSTKDLIPEMKHYMIRDGHVRAFNGVIALSSPIELTLDCKPKAVPMVAAIRNCEDVVSMGMTGAGRLRIQSGDFKAFIECSEGEDALHVGPEGVIVELDGEAFLSAVKVLLPFVGNDASRPWTNGILIRGQSAFATNNVCLVEYWLGSDFPHVVNIPMVAIKEVVRVNLPPVSVQVAQGSLTIHYDDGRWIRTQLFGTEWPDLTKILNKPSDQEPVPEELFPALAKIKPFVEKSGLVYFIDGQVSTHEVDDLGARHHVEGLHGDGLYHINMLGLLEGAAQTVDFKLYPEPLLFFGDRLRGAIVGLRK